MVRLAEQERNLRGERERGRGEREKKMDIFSDHFGRGGSLVDSSTAIPSAEVRRCPCRSGWRIVYVLPVSLLVNICILVIVSLRPENASKSYRRS